MYDREIKSVGRFSVKILGKILLPLCWNGTFVPQRAQKFLKFRSEFLS